MPPVPHRVACVEATQAVWQPHIAQGRPWSCLASGGMNHWAWIHKVWYSYVWAVKHVCTRCHYVSLQKTCHQVPHEQRPSLHMSSCTARMVSDRRYMYASAMQRYRRYMHASALQRHRRYMHASALQRSPLHLSCMMHTCESQGKYI